VAHRILRPERMTVAAVGPLTAAIQRKVKAAIRTFPEDGSPPRSS